MLSFANSAPRGYSEEIFVSDEEWNMGYFVGGLSFKDKAICFESDYLSGRCTIPSLPPMEIAGILTF